MGQGQERLRVWLLRILFRDNALRMTFVSGLGGAALQRKWADVEMRIRGSMCFSCRFYFPDVIRVRTFGLAVIL